MGKSIYRVKKRNGSKINSWKILQSDGKETVDREEGKINSILYHRR